MSSTSDTYIKKENSYFKAEFTPEEIDKDLFFQDFVNTGIRDSTRHKYLQWMRMFCRFTGKTPTELIEEADADEDKNIKMWQRGIKKYLQNFKEALENTGKSTNYIKSILVTVRGFYKHFEIQRPEDTMKFIEEKLLQTTHDLQTKKISKKHSNIAI